MDSLAVCMDSTLTRIGWLGKQADAVPPWLQSCPADPTPDVQTARGLLENAVTSASDSPFMEEGSG